MVNLTIEGAIVQEGSTLRMDVHQVQVETIEDAVVVIEGELGRPIESHDAVIVFGGDVWAAIS